MQGFPSSSSEAWLPDSMMRQTFLNLGLKHLESDGFKVSPPPPFSTILDGALLGLPALGLWSLVVSFTAKEMEAQATLCATCGRQPFPLDELKGFGKILLK